MPGLITTSSIHLSILKGKLTKSPKTRHQIYKSSCSVAEDVSQAVSELVSQCEQVVSNIHAIVVMNGCQLR